MEKKNDNDNPQKPQPELFNPGKNTNWLTGQPEGKAKPTEISTTHKIGKGWK